MMLTPKEELKREQEKLSRLLQDREQIEIAIAKAKRRVAAWAELCDDTEAGEQVVELDLGGLTDVCRTVLRASRKGSGMTVSEVQQAVKELGFPLHEYKAPAASLTTTLNRLAESGEVHADRRNTPGATEYKWVGPTLTSLRKAFQTSLAKVKPLAPRIDKKIDLNDETPRD